jgi:hypothetical protein
LPEALQNKTLRKDHVFSALPGTSIDTGTYSFFHYGIRLVIRIVKIGKEDTTMKTLFKKFETIMVAASFAEAGEFETARRIANEDRVRKNDRPTQRPASRKELRAD